MDPTESAVCDCVGGEPGFTLDVENGLWVHGQCRRPTRMYLDAMFDRAVKER